MVQIAIPLLRILLGSHRSRTCLRHSWLCRCIGIIWLMQLTLGTLHLNLPGSHLQLALALWLLCVAVGYLHMGRLRPRVFKLLLQLAVVFLGDLQDPCTCAGIRMLWPPTFPLICTCRPLGFILALLKDWTSLIDTLPRIVVVTSSLVTPYLLRGVGLNLDSQVQAGVCCAT